MINIISFIILIIICIELLISFYTLIFLFNYHQDNIDTNIKDYPTVSIIVPAYNEEKNIKNTLDRLINLDYPKDKLNIIVVDDGSIDNTYNIAKEYEKYHIVKVYRKENSGKSSAINFGIKNSNSEYIVVLDADSIPGKDSLKKMIKYFYFYDVDIVIPSVQVNKTDNIIQKYQYIDYVVYNFSRISLDSMESLFIAPGPFSVFKKEVFDKIGLFDEKNITEDMEIALRAQKNGFKIKYCPESIIYTEPPDTFIKLLRQRSRWYLGFIENFNKYRDIENEYLREIGFGISITLQFIIPVAFFIILYTYLYQLYNFFIYLSLINYNIFYIFQNYSFNINTYIFELFSTNLIILYLFSLLLLINFLLFLSFYHKIDKSRSFRSLIFYSIIYLFLSLYFNAIFIIVSFYYKLFGRKLKWGGLEWNNSLINRLINR
ncbi:glycosyl transferase [Nanobdella aerobiophila]|uniref:Glycosyl transferase n=1 Tax=Nanobdella aerobiophila TaxID=2586965 RepID=A0A915SCE9_9ARCH|nr:glycosyltransferase family 2 protein [Nanobdella aerobiophila]BBL45328.1 glycosyl transferase [Nanobdella aerobiophila]